MKEQNGKLTLISTPIGNLEDITLRAIDTLKCVDVLLCETINKTKGLLKKHGIETDRTLSYCDMNKEKKLSRIKKLLKEGNHIGLVCNAGSPSISDPGFSVVNEAVKEGYTVDSVPGVSAVIPALQLSGLPSDSFSFYGFCPGKENKRIKFYRKIKKDGKTSIFFESPHRLKESLEAALEILGENKDGALTRELTKKYQEIIRGTLLEINEKISCKENIKGEITMVIAGSTVKQRRTAELNERFQYLTETVGLSGKDAVRLMAAEEDIPRSDLYERFLVDQD